jgi:putative membrane protein
LHGAVQLSNICKISKKIILTKEKEKYKDKPLIEYIDLTRWREAPFLMIKGFLMGSADIVPGVSGGTMALITGIYDRLIFAIKSLNASAVKSALTLRFEEFFSQLHWKFILFLGTGMVFAVIFFTRIVPLQIYMYTHAELIYGLFFGLIVGSVFLLISEIKKSERKLKVVIPLIAGALFGFWIVTLVPADTPETFWYVFLTGSVAISAMILPGISGSYILLIFRKYDYILEQLSMLGTNQTWEASLNLLPFVMGLIIGIIVFSRILSWLLKNFHTVTIVVLIGFLIGSLYVIWPYQHREYEEIVLNTVTLPVTDPLVQQLMQQEDVPDQPEYQRIGQIINSESTLGEFTVVEIETVARKIISSEPFIPWLKPASEVEGVNKAGGVAGMSIGLIMIFGISYLRRKT